LDHAEALITFAAQDWLFASDVRFCIPVQQERSEHEADAHTC